MKRLLMLILASSLIVGTQAVAENIQACFAPGTSCHQKVISHLARAKKSIRIQTGELTSLDMISTLEKARQKGVNVKILLDQKSVFDHKNAIEALQKKNVPFMLDVSTDRNFANHVIIDGTELIVGSSAFTDDKKTTGDILFIKNDPKLTEKYDSYFAKRFQGSETLEQFCKHSVQCKFNKATDAAKKTARNVWEDTKNLLDKHIK